MDSGTTAGGEPSADDPTIVVEQSRSAGEKPPLWSAHGAEDARARVEEALGGVQAGQPKDRKGAAPAGPAGTPSADADASASDEDTSGSFRARAGEAANDARDKASEAGAKAAGFAASARDRVANTDVRELAAGTTSLIDTARPFFLAAFALVFTVLGFVEGDSGTSQWFVAGAILFVLAAGFSDELGHLARRRGNSR